MRSLSIVLAGAAALIAVQAMADGDPVAGKAVFMKCGICHSVEPGGKKIGPTLFGVVGRASGTIDGFEYSPAMKAANKVWDAKELDTYLTDPKAEVPGTKMLFPGLKNDADRQNVIAYLSTLK